jgi:ADP-heptose:LPS heptosyltransferase
MQLIQGACLGVLGDIKSVLIIRCGALGDLVYSTSIMEALRAEYGEDIAIDWVCKPGPGTLFKHDPRVRHVFPLNHRRFPIWMSKEKRAIINFSKKEPYDLLVNLESGVLFYPLAEKIQAKHQVGAPFSTTKTLTKMNRAAMLNQFYSNIVSEQNMLKAYPTIQGKEYFDVQIQFSLPTNFIILAPSNSHNKKTMNYRAWPQKYWQEFFKLVAKDLNVIIIGAKGEEHFFSELKPFPDNFIDLTGKCSISELITIIENADAMISIDSAPGHIAAAVNTPVIVLMGPTDPISDSPYQTTENDVNVVCANIECSPCYNTPTMFACTDNQCMKAIAPSQVLHRLQILLEKNMNRKITQ